MFMKYTIRFRGLALMLLLLLPAAVQAQLVFSTNSGAITITGCSSSLANLVIPTSTNGFPVTSISALAFSGCSGLTSVAIPNSVTSIGYDVFSGCSGLTNIFVGAGNLNYASVGGVLFNKAMTLLVQYPAGLPYASYVIPNRVTSIGEYAFWSCSGVTNVTMGDSVTSIGDVAFAWCSGLTSVTLPNSVISIGEGTFAACSRLANVTIGNRVTSIGHQAFYDCLGLTSVTIPNTVTSIGNSAFDSCYGLTSVYFQGNAPTVDGQPGSSDGTVFLGESGTAYYLPGTMGWGASYGGWPTSGWYQAQPVILNSGIGWGGQSNRFGFTISWATNHSVIVQACTNLSHPVWTLLATNPLVSGTNYFSDPKETNYPTRFYRIQSP